MPNKNHWYDGLFYDKVIAPNQDKVFEIVKDIVDKGSVILDAGCGTGRMAFRLWGKYDKYTGIDLSIRNINTAKSKLSKLHSEKIEFIHADAYSYLQRGGTKYDYAVLSYVIHELDEQERVPLLKLLSKHSENIIVVDYLVPRPGGFTDRVNGVVEYVAGRKHYRNFQSYVSNEGIPGLAKHAGLNIIKEIADTPKTAHIVSMKGAT